MPATEARSKGGEGEQAFWKDDVCCAFNLEQQDICLASATCAAVLGSNVLETGLQVLTWPATKPTLLQVRCFAAATTCAPQPAAFGGNKFVFNLKTFHSSLAFCSLIYGAKRFLFKYHRVKFLHGFPLIFFGC